MIPEAEIKCLLDQYGDLDEVSLLPSSKHYYVFVSETCPELFEDLHSLLPYAPHWEVGTQIIATSKLVYAQIIKDLVSSRYGSAWLVHGQLVDIRAGP